MSALQSHPALSILILDKDPKSAQKLSALLSSEGYRPSIARSPDAALSAPPRCDIACLDTAFGPEAITRVIHHLRSRPAPPAILLLSESVKDKIPAVLAHLDVFDDVPHTADNRRLLTSVRNAASYRRMSLRIARLEREVEGRTIDGLVGQSATMRRLYSDVHRVSPLDASVLLLGEPGVGKDTVARIIHGHSPYADGPFISFDCAAQPVNTQDAALFGVEVDSQVYTAGALEQAHNGTLLIHNLPALSLLVQARFVQALERGRFFRVNGVKDLPLNVRFITTAHRRLNDGIRQGLIREDLYARLSSFEVSIPTLRERLGDAPLLANHFLQTLSAQSYPGRPFSLSDASLALIASYEWPGNVRELRAAVEHALAASPNGEVLPQHLPTYIHSPELVPPAAPARGRRSRGPRLAYSADPAPSPPVATLADVERGTIEGMMRKANGNISLAARQLGIGRSTLYRKLKAYGHKID